VFNFTSAGLLSKWTLYEGISDKVNGLAVDWTTDVVYWTDATYDVILAASMGPTDVVEVIKDTGLDEPFGLIVYPQKG